jgi:hypothetical protein
MDGPRFKSMDQDASTPYFFLFCGLVVQVVIGCASI